jgi:hypothetical protein
LFFFDKKNQKTFIHGLGDRSAARCFVARTS